MTDASSDSASSLQPFVLGVDLDGVCGDYTSAFREIVARDQGVTTESLGEHLTWEFTEWG